MKRLVKEFRMGEFLFVDNTKKESETKTGKLKAKI